MEVGRAASERWRLAAAEYILDSLRTLLPVTIIIPIHDACKNLERCLESVVENTSASAKLLLVDGANADPDISSLLEEYEALENVRVLRNEAHPGLARAVDRGLSESEGDVVLLGPDTEVTPRWLENLTLAAHTNPRTATVTPLSNGAAAFSVPEPDRENPTPDGLTRDGTGRLITQQSRRLYPQTPVGNRFCIYIKRATLNEVGSFDGKNFPRSYGGEEDFCLRSLKRGWNNVVDDATFVFHRRADSSGDKQREAAAARETLDRLHPERAKLAQAFVDSDDLRKVRNGVRAAYQEAESGEIQAKPRILFVLHQASGGTPHTNLDLMNALSDRYSPYVLVSDTRNLKLYRHEAGEQPVPVEEWRLNRACHVTEFHRSDYRAAAFEALTGYGFELVHIRHLIGHTFDLPEVATCLNVPVILSFHDFYFSCPTVHLIDDHGKHCGGICTPGHGRCTIPTPRLEQQLPALKHLWIKTWRQQVERMFEHVDVFVTTSRTSKDVYLRSLPGLSERPFRIIEHGRDLPQNHLATPPGDGPIRILIPGNVSTHKGAGFIRDLKKIDSENRLELHFLGRVPDKFQELGISHGTYEREEFDDRVREIRPSFMGIFSIWPETYCHTLTEAWATGVPVLASDIGTLKERITAHGGGWLVDHENPGRAYEQILEIAGKQDEYARELKRANLEGVRSTREMAGDYAELYRMVLSRRRQFKASE